MAKRIFLSYASEHKAIAEPIAFSLRHRGFEVFLDRDDLPAGRSYDEQIEQAVARVDLFVFLISPESVASGRFTLTELEFARRRWRRADGHVLPVMVADTDLALVPPFLKSVNILEPAGNVSAEVSSAVSAMTRPPAAQWVVPAALATGAVTGLMAAYLPLPLEAIPASPEKVGYVIHYPGYAPIGAPIFFAAGLVGLLRLFDSAVVARAVPVVVGVFAGWLAAINIFLQLGGQTDVSGDPANVAKVTTIAVIAIGAMCGAAGGAFTWLGSAIAVNRLMRFEAFVLVTAVGLAFGTILPLINLRDMPWPLFCLWQAAVAASIAWWLSRTPEPA